MALDIQFDRDGIFIPKTIEELIAAIKIRIHIEDACSVIIDDDKEFFIEKIVNGYEISDAEDASVYLESFTSLKDLILKNHCGFSLPLLCPNGRVAIHIPMIK